MKVCKKCSFSGDDSNFYTRELVCKPCRIQKVKEYYHANTEQKKKYVAAWAKLNPDKVKATVAKRKRADPEKFKDYAAKHRLRTRYGIDLETYKLMLQEQYGVCYICKKEETSTSKLGIPKRLSLDHHHKTGVVRRLLCDNCNRGVGAFKDNPCLMRIAADYLEEYV